MPISYDPQAQLSHRVQGWTGDYGFPVQGHESGPAYRPAVYTQSHWGGIDSWQTDSRLDYPPEYRVKITAGAVADTANIYLLNNMPSPISFAPIAIQEYALATQMVYNGGGSYNEYGG